MCSKYTIRSSSGTKNSRRATQHSTKPSRSAIRGTWSVTVCGCCLRPEHLTSLATRKGFDLQPNWYTNGGGGSSRSRRHRCQSSLASDSSYPTSRASSSAQWPAATTLRSRASLRRSSRALRLASATASWRSRSRKSSIAPRRCSHSSHRTDLSGFSFRKRYLIPIAFTKLTYNTTTM